MIDSIFHSSLPPYVVGEVKLGATVSLRLRAAADLPITQVLVRSTPEGEEVFTVMKRSEGDADRSDVQWWEAEVSLEVPLFDYRFLIRCGGQQYWLSALGVSCYTPLDSANFKLMVQNKVPAWVSGSVFYQIFPDRFCNGDDSLTVRDGEYELSGHPTERHPWKPFDPTRTHSHVFCGGDIPGIISKLDYLQELGVNALYVNPIFTAPSNHKYDVADYYRVDPHLGGDAALVELRQEMAKRNMRLVLDIVPNHCGQENRWFKEAQRDQHAPEADFFTFQKHPDEYECWLGVKTLPRLNYASSLLAQRMYAGKDAVMRYWLRPPFSIDGWRIDVANMLGRRGTHQLGHSVGQAIRLAVKEENPQAWVLGENFFDGTGHLQGDELDATMNYSGFCFPVLQWLCGRNYKALDEEMRGRTRLGANYSYLPTAALVEQLNRFRAAIPEEVALNQFNLLGSHDTPRVLSMARGDVERLKVAAVCLFTYQGVPCVYYGDEVGMSGGGDPDCRQPMEWDESRWNQEIGGHYRRLISLRRHSPALQRGCLQMLSHPQGVCYVREGAGERWLVALNRGPVPGDAWERADTQIEVRAAALPEGSRWQEVFSGRLATVSGGFLAAMPAGLGAALWRQLD